jgi:putative two-component system response regulator
MSEAAGKTTALRVLVVDDEEANRKLLEALLCTHGFDVRCARDGAEALQEAGSFRPDLIMLDVMMPRVTGFEAAQALRRNPDTRSTPIIMLTQLDDRASRLHALEVGADEFVSKPVDPTEVLVRVRNLLRARVPGVALAPAPTPGLPAAAPERLDDHAEAMHVLLAAIGYRDETTDAHLRRISLYTALLAHELGLDEEFTDTIFYASPMHDVGQLGVPAAILLKHGELTEREREVVKSHTLLGERLLRRGDSPTLRMGADIAAAHHEHWDGSGYPRGLSGESIPLAARIMLVCDRYDALRSRRPYKEEMEHERVVKILRRGDYRSEPTHFDPQVLAAFLNIHTAFDDTYRKNNG